MKKILLTGAGGNLGTMLRQRFHHLPCFRGVNLKVSDHNEFISAPKDHEVQLCDLANLEHVKNLVTGCESIIHLGGISEEASFDSILESNIRGTYNIYEAARQQGISRVVFASSNHVTGYHPSETSLNANSQMRPDSIYGISKGFGELVARYYYDKFNIESACIRIGSCFPEPTNRRMLSTWLSYTDFTSLLEAVISTKNLGFAIVYGVSANQDSWWDNCLVEHLNWKPKDNAAVYADKIISASGEEELETFQGGEFARQGHVNNPK